MTSVFRLSLLLVVVVVVVVTGRPNYESDPLQQAWDAFYSQSESHNCDDSDTDFVALSKRDVDGVLGAKSIGYGREEEPEEDPQNTRQLTRGGEQGRGLKRKRLAKKGTIHDEAPSHGDKIGLEADAGVKEHSEDLRVSRSHGKRHGHEHIHNERLSDARHGIERITEDDDDTKGGKEHRKRGLPSNHKAEDQHGTLYSEEFHDDKHKNEGRQYERDADTQGSIKDAGAEDAFMPPAGGNERVAVEDDKTGSETQGTLGETSGLGKRNLSPLHRKKKHGLTSHSEAAEGSENKDGEEDMSPGKQYGFERKKRMHHLGLEEKNNEKEIDIDESEGEIDPLQQLEYDVMKLEESMGPEDHGNKMKEGIEAPELDVRKPQKSKKVMDIGLKKDTLTGETEMGANTRLKPHKEPGMRMPDIGLPADPETGRLPNANEMLKSKSYESQGGVMHGQRQMERPMERAGFDGALEEVDEGPDNNNNKKKRMSHRKSYRESREDY